MFGLKRCIHWIQSIPNAVWVLLVLLQPFFVNVDKCLTILQLDAKVLKFFQDVSSMPNTPRSQTDCCRGLTYKYHVIKVNAQLEKGHKKEAVASLKECVKYELDEGYTFDQQNWAFILPMAYGVDQQRQLELLSDDQIWETLQTMQTHWWWSSERSSGTCAAPQMYSVWQEGKETW